MKVSIIVPVYNTALYLDRCIESLVNQSYKDIEILLVDDGSTDNSRQVCAYWAEKDSRIVCLHKENGGQASARNMGLDKASGQYICFIDSDDCISPDFVKTLLDMCLENDVKVSCCGYALTDEVTPYDMIDVSGQDRRVEITDKYSYFERMYTDKEIYYVIVCNKIFHSSIFAQLRFEEGKIHEDEGIIPYTIDFCDKVAICYQPLYYYTVRQGSTMKVDYFKPGNLSILEFWQDRMDYFERNGWQTLVYLTMKNYLVKCLELYNKIDDETADGDMYRKHLMAAYRHMLAKMKKYPVKSRKFVLQMEYFGLFPKKFAGTDRSRFLFGNQ